MLAAAVPHHPRRPRARPLHTVAHRPRRRVRARRAARHDAQPRVARRALRPPVRAPRNGAHVTAVSASRGRPRRARRACPGSRPPRARARSPTSPSSSAREGDAIGLIDPPRARARSSGRVSSTGRRAAARARSCCGASSPRDHGAARRRHARARRRARRAAAARRRHRRAAGTDDGGWADPADVRRGSRRAGSRCSSASRCGCATRRRRRVRRGRGAADGRAHVSTGARERAELTDDSRRMLTILQTTTLLALLAAAFTLATAIGGRVLAQRRQIGLLRAIGLTPRGVDGAARRPLPRAGALAAPLGLLAGALLGDRLSATPPTRSARPRPAPPSAGAARARAADRAGRRRRGDRAARLARRADAGAGRARARARRELGARLARRRGSRGGCACRSWSASAPRTRSRSAAAPCLTVGEPRAGRRAGCDRDGLRGDDGPPRQRPGAARAAVRPAAVESLAAAATRSIACSPARGEVAAVARVREIVLTGRGGREIHARVLDGPAAARSPTPSATAAARARPARSTLGRGALDALGARIGRRASTLTRRAAQPVTLRVVGRHVEPDDDGRGAVTPLTSLPRRRGDARRPVLGGAPLARRRPGADRAPPLRREGDGRLARRAPDRVAAARGGRHAPGRLRHGRAADRDRGAQPADDAGPRRSASASATTPCSPRSARRRARFARR